MTAGPDSAAAGDATKRFSDRAADYAASRPSYGADALAFVLAGLRLPVQVADLGAGTGISARLLAGRGCSVLAVEPNASMRERAEPHSGVEFVDGTGEATGLPDGSVDLVTAFQAFHWFANSAALAECTRILRPSGRAALVLNERDERDSFAAAYGGLYRRYALDDTEERRLRSIDVFKLLPGHLAEHEFYHAQRLDRRGLQRRTASSSYVPNTGEAARRLRAEVDTLFDRWAVNGFVDVALRTIVVRIDVVPGA